MEKYILIGLVAVALLILCVQIITEIIKSVITDESKYYNLIVLCVSVVLTVATAIAACMIAGITITWYIILAAIVLSFFVAYGAMLGYDKLFKKVFESIKTAVNSYKNISEGEDSK